MSLENALKSYSVEELFEHYIDLPADVKLPMELTDLSSPKQTIMNQDKFGKIQKIIKVDDESTYGYQLCEKLKNKLTELDDIDLKLLEVFKLAPICKPANVGSSKFTTIHVMDMILSDDFNATKPEVRDFFKFIFLEVIPYKYDTISMGRSAICTGSRKMKINIKPLLEGIVKYMDSCKEYEDPAVITLIAELIWNFQKICEYPKSESSATNMFTHYLNGIDQKVAQEVVNILKDVSKTNEFSKELEDVIDSGSERFKVVESTIEESTWVRPGYFENAETMLDGSERLMNIFGDKIFEDFELPAAKEDLRHLNRENIQAYLPEELNGPVSFDIDPNSKMYLKDELQCKLMIAQINRGDQIDEVTIINYEGDTFVLFKTKADETLILGISMSFAGIRPSRKLITIYNDDELNYRFVPEI